MDAVYVVGPFWNDATSTGHPGEAASSTKTVPAYAPANRAANGMPDPDELLDRYTKIAGWDPRKEGNGRDMEIAKVFHHVRGGTISHGIQARTISGQASSDFSHVYFENTKRSLDSALKRVRRLKEEEKSRAKL